MLKYALFSLLAYLALVSGQDCQSAPYDIVYVIDDSGSIGSQNFAKVRDALHDAVEDYNIGPSDSETHIGAVTFTDQAYLEFNLAAHTTVPDAVNAIDSLPYRGGNTNIYSGMQEALDQVFGQAGDRAAVVDYMVVITDGKDTSPVATAQAEAASRGIKVFAVGVGNGVDYDQLLAVAGSASRVRNVTSFDFLKDAIRQIPCPRDPRCDGKKCVDQHQNCAQWATSGLCSSNPQSANDMREMCPVSCGYCEEICDDVECPKECAKRAAAGQCSTNPQMPFVCKKSCGLCGCVNMHSACPQLAAENPALCQTNPVVRASCKLSCNLCALNTNCTILDPASGLCPRDWKYSAATNSCYVATPHLLPIGGTRGICLNAGGDLASIHSLAENDILTNYFPSPAPDARDFLYYIGLARNNNPATWASSSFWFDGTTGSFRLWDNVFHGALFPQPNGGVNEIYSTIVMNGAPGHTATAKYSNGYWHDVFVANFPGFCKRPICSPTPPPPPAVCVNLHSACPTMAASCATDATVRANCRATCGLCVPNKDCSVLDSTGKCPRDWKYFNETNKCYLATPNVQQFNPSRTYCRDANNIGDVVSINDQVENDFITNFYPNPPPVAGIRPHYIGLFRSNNPATWASSGLWTDGHNYGTGYKRWDDVTHGVIPPQPNGDNGAVFTAIILNGDPGHTTTPTFSNGYWHDWDAQNFPAFCERPVCATP